MLSFATGRPIKYHRPSKPPVWLNKSPGLPFLATRSTMAAISEAPCILQAISFVNRSSPIFIAQGFNLDKSRKSCNILLRLWLKMADIEESSSSNREASPP